MEYDGKEYIEKQPVCSKTHLRNFLKSKKRKTKKK